jgi:hypothetical protein
MAGKPPEGDRVMLQARKEPCGIPDGVVMGPRGEQAD